MEKDGLPYYIYELTRHRLVAATATGMVGAPLPGLGIKLCYLLLQCCLRSIAHQPAAVPCQVVINCHCLLVRCRQPAVHAERAVQQPAVAQGGQQAGKNSGFLPGAAQD